MDKGAHFRRCDFQVHTPRDAQWHGTEAATPAERKTYAEELIQACRSQGLEAIAITDHHDFAFLPYIKAAAESEVDATGTAVPREKQVVVFPGLELTLSSPPCQSILLLDSDFDQGKLDDIIMLLGLEITDEGRSKLPSVDSVSPTSVTGLNDLENKLSLHKWLKGRFIILPNVTDGGYKSMLREGFDKHYKEMRCVGGYVDGDYEKTSVGKKNILEGRQQNNGYKPLAVFQTSDNRRRDHSTLGAYTTWVKWSEPTAEALRQACLARESRLSLNEPLLPSLWITSMSVSTSKFLSRIEIDFNQQYNAVIGGRGTGKSTILEYLRWGLCDQPVDDTESDIAPLQKRRKKLIDDTLRTLNGEVIVAFLSNGVRHIIKRNSTTQEILLKIGNSDFASTTEQEVRNLFPVQAYSQKQLSSVGVRIDELKRFVELPIKQILDQIRSEIRDTEAKIRVTYGSLIRKREIEAEVAKHNLEITSLTERRTELQKALKGLSEADQKVIKLKARYDNEEVITDDLKNALAEAEALIEGLEGQFDEKIAGMDNELEVENAALLKSISSKYNTKFSEIRKQIRALAGSFQPASLKDIHDEVAKWEALKKAFDKKYEGAKANATANQEQLKQIQLVENRIAELNKLQRQQGNALKALGDPGTGYKRLRRTWNDLHLQKLQALNGQCQQFSTLSDGLIEADVKRSLDVDALNQRLKTAFASLNIRKIDDVCAHLGNATDPIAMWDTILTEFEKLALHDAAGADPLPETPTIDECGFIATEKARLAKGFDATKWLDLSVTELEFNPVFQYCTNKENSEYIEFADASAGQQATALLTVLLNQEGAPLIIDQPEDDVDSKMSPAIVQQIWKAKSRRQLIFSSHNANFVVNGDAELVICCDYVRAGDQTGGRIKAEGAIDNKGIREEITTVTEGGEKAFKLRKEKYGF